MSQGYGRHAYAGIGVESVYGTPVAATKFFEIDSENMKGSRKRLISKVLGTVSNRRTHREKIMVGGGIVLPFQWNGCERLIADAFGASAVTTGGSNPYTHTYALKAAMPTGLTVVVNRDAANIGAGTMFQYGGCHVNKLKLSNEGPDSLLTIAAEFVGQAVEDVTIEAATFPTFDPIDFGMMTISRYDVDSAALDLKTLKWSLEIDNRLEPAFYLTSNKSQGVHRTDKRLVTFEMEVEYETQAIYTAFFTAAEQDWRFKWMKDSATDTVNTLQLDLPKAFIDEGEPETSGSGPYRTTIKATAEMSAADNDELVMVLKNTSSSI